MTRKNRQKHRQNDWQFSPRSSSQTHPTSCYRGRWPDPVLSLASTPRCAPALVPRMPLTVLVVMPRVARVRVGCRAAIVIHRDTKNRRTTQPSWPVSPLAPRSRGDHTKASVSRRGQLQLQPYHSPRAVARRRARHKDGASPLLRAVLVASNPFSGCGSQHPRQRANYARAASLAHQHGAVHRPGGI